LFCRQGRRRAVNGPLFEFDTPPISIIRVILMNGSAYFTAANNQPGAIFPISSISEVLISFISVEPALRATLSIKFDLKLKV
jgi:hypothetical protein